ncbi:Vps52-domain-containing protein [Basidiobolus meristosporus CBS 931.73]|uniref:Vps52-domain-containing protein n=1 Tax=Basidiobolus meristosporus CBS 931.73 TaxID=1314790 RepID=A0A1Y1Y7M4_9FUNG|nr:Vps52-domain-containing protein [Basidiobolus meristosporus CBS 931.73]|eukprot:ORX93736.1 Vps52-domain-containing protein [Basidiobolus meristosporus CBS 931.73]
MSAIQTQDRISEFQEDPLVRKAVMQGMDLRKYAKTIEDQLKAIEQEHILEYVAQAENFVDLNQDIKACDEILETMESLLTGFQSNLGNINNDIQSLQKQSLAMNQKLKNRLSLEQELSELLEGIVIPPKMVKAISENEVNEAYLECLIALNKKMTFVKANNKKGIHALQEVGPEFEKLRLKASYKIREFLLDKVKSLRIPNTNIQMIQQTVFLKYTEFNRFLMKRHRESAAEVRQHYINTMRAYFFNHFDRYNRGLLKLQSTIADKLDMIGLGESTKHNFFGVGKHLKDKSNVFALGNRANVLGDQEAGVILLHVAHEKNLKYPYEMLFHSFNTVLADNATSEFQFVSEFFTHPDANESEPVREIPRLVFEQIFEPTLKLSLSATKQYIETSYDAIGILICIRINTKLAMETQHRSISSLESYSNAINLLCWPRFQIIMNQHIDSVKKASAHRLMSSKDVHPQYITRKYAEFASSILILNQGYEDALLTNSLVRLRTEVEGLLVRMSLEFSDRIDRYTFLINNYDLIVSILSEANVKTAEGEIEHTRALLNSKIAEFVEEQLSPYFGDLMKFVKQAEKEPDLATIPQDQFERISSHFNSNWRNEIASINSSVIQKFSNFKNGTTILHTVLGQLLVYYTRFHALLDKRFDKKSSGHGFKQAPIGIQNVMVEIKKYRSNF